MIIANMYCSNVNSDQLSLDPLHCIKIYIIQQTKLNKVKYRSNTLLNIAEKRFMPIMFEKLVFAFFSGYACLLSFNSPDR